MILIVLSTFSMSPSTVAYKLSGKTIILRAASAPAKVPVSQAAIAAIKWSSVAGISSLGSTP